MSKTLCQMVYEQVKTQYNAGAAREPITSASDILSIKAVADLSAKSTEIFGVITLDGANQVIKYHEVTKGLVNHSLVHPRETYRAAIIDNAISIICVHNHPSGRPEPSQQDINITNQLKNAGEILGIQLLDHIIVTKNGVYSLREFGYL